MLHFDAQGQYPSRMYANEQELVNAFLAQIKLNSPWGTVSVCAEFAYQRGRADIVALNSSGQLIAFEAKLYKWRDALKQAYRNTCFAHRSYVLLPKTTALRASRESNAFDQRNVGICYIDDGLVILHEAVEVDPIQPWLSAKATAKVTSVQEQRIAD